MGEGTLLRQIHIWDYPYQERMENKKKKMKNTTQAVYGRRKVQVWGCMAAHGVEILWW